MSNGQTTNEAQGGGSGLNVELDDSDWKKERMYELIRASLKAQWLLSQIAIDTKEDETLSSAQTALAALSNATLPFVEL